MRWTAPLRNCAAATAFCAVPRRRSVCSFQLPRLSPFGTGAPAWCGDSGRRAEIVPGAVFSGSVLRLALKREAGWQERPLVVLGPLESAVAKFAGASKQLRARGGEGLWTAAKAAITPQRGSREGESPPFISCMRRSGLRLGGEAAEIRGRTGNARVSRRAL